MTDATHEAELRLAELLAALSLVTDLARGRPPEEALRACLLATRLAGALGLGRDETSHVYYMTLLRFVGCTAPSHEYGQAFGADHVDGRGRGDMSDMTQPREALAFVATFSEGRPAWRRPAAFLSALTRAPAAGREGIRGDCEVAVRMARRFQLAEPVAQALYQSFERWAGHGPPQGLAGEAIALPARLAAVAFAVAMYLQEHGREAAVEVVRRWRGRSLDPALADAFLQRSGELMQGLEGEDLWPAVLAAEPPPPRRVRGGGIDEVARGFADFVDLKSPYLHGHSAGVAAGRRRRSRLRARRTRGDRSAPVGPRPRHRPGGNQHRHLGETRPAHDQRMGAGPAPPLPHRAHPDPLGSVRPPGPTGRHAPRACGRFRLPSRGAGGFTVKVDADPGRRRRLPGADRGARPPPGAGARSCRARA